MNYAIEILKEKLIDVRSTHETALKLIERNPTVYSDIAAEYGQRATDLEKALEVLEREK